MSFSNKLITEKNGSRYGRMIQPWLRKKTDMIATSPSRRDGMTYDEELSKRQQGGVFIYDMVMALTQGKGEHGLSGVAASLFNRFFNLHSFKACDFRDIAAACVFLAGKNEDTPKKLKYVVNQLWQLKYPTQKHFPSEKTFIEQCNVVTLLEEVLLKTVSFDINVDLPHQHVLKLMRDVEKGRNVYKEMVKTAYYMATDVLIITDWSVRYSCASVATACVNIAAFFHNIQMKDIVPADMAKQWFCFQDSSMTLDEINAMTKEFLDIYARNPQFHIGSLRKIDIHQKVKLIRRPPGMSPVQQTSLQPSTSSSNLKKLDLESYKGRQRGPSANLDSTSPAVRQSFLPDVKNQTVVEQGLAEHAAQQMHYQQRNQQFVAKRGNEFEDGNVSKKSRMENGVHITYDESTTSITSSTSTTIRGHHQPMYNMVVHQSHQQQQQTHQMVNYHGNQTLMPLMMQPPPPPPPPQMMHQHGGSMMHQPQEQPQQSEYQKMCMQLDKSRNPQYADGTTTSSTSEEHRNSTMAATHPSFRQQPPPQQQRTLPGTNATFHGALMAHYSSTKQISPPDDASPPLLPPPPPPPVLMPLLEEGELV